jgi:hypothetical protein
VCRKPRSGVLSISSTSSPGSTGEQPDNLALACWQCNFKKGPNLTGIDPETAQVTPLFHPRNDKWVDHFEVEIETLMPFGIEIRGLTPEGRTTVRVLGMNDEMRQMLRYELWREGVFDAAS